VNRVNGVRFILIATQNRFLDIICRPNYRSDHKIGNPSLMAVSGNPTQILRL
jgi:hypothetical protein